MKRSCTARRRPGAWRPQAWLVALALLPVCGTAAADGEPAAARRAELIRMVRQDCGSCHGMRLLGGLGPALTPQTLADKPAEALEFTILQGRPGTPMPPWSRFLSEAEARWIVARLQAGFPEDEAPRAQGGHP